LVPRHDRVLELEALTGKELCKPIAGSPASMTLTPPWDVFLIGGAGQEAVGGEAGPGEESGEDREGRRAQSVAESLVQSLLAPQFHAGFRGCVRVKPGNGSFKARPLRSPN